MRTIVFVMILNLIVWIAVNAALAVRYGSWAFAIGRCRLKL